MILLYRCLTTFFYPLFVVFIFIRKFLGKEDSLRYKEKIFSRYFKVDKKINNKLIWFHAASIGELKSILPIIKEINLKKNDIEFLITTVTLSSSYLANQELKKIKNSYHRFLPIDVNFLIKNFIKHWRPNAIFLVDSEIWPNLILNSKDLEVPIALINARLTSNSFKKWMMFPKTARKIFSVFDLFICSNSETKTYLEKLNLKNIHFNGNLKLISNIENKEINNINENRLLNKKVWLAASTHKDEDIFCIKTHLKLKEKFSKIVTIIAPRHIDRAKDIKSISNKFGLNSQILDENEVISENIEIIIINHFGALQNYYKYAKSAFIGKSLSIKLKKVGGQNPIEAAKSNCKIYHGPYVYNFEEIYNILEKKNISKMVTNYKELSFYLSKDLENPSSKENSYISEFVNNLGKKTLIDTIKLVDDFIR